MSLLERVFYFHQEILKDRYPNSRTIAEEFEVSIPTAKRDITYLKDRLQAPLIFNRKHNGYTYEGNDFQLPLDESPRLILFTALLNKLADEAGLGSLKEVEQLQKKLLEMTANGNRRILDVLQVQWIETESFSSEIFEAVMDAFVQKRMLQITYHSLGGKSAERVLAPLQIINYQGRWYLYAYCTLRKANRLFHLGRIKAAKTDKTPLPEDISFDQKSLDTSFGIFQGKAEYITEILFTSTAAEIVKDQKWHKNQQVTTVEEGIILKLPVSDYREIMMKVLQYGKMAQVISPPHLVEHIRKEIDAMKSAYTA